VLLFILILPDFSFVSNVAQIFEHLTRNSSIRAQVRSKAPVVLLSKKQYTHCSVLIGSRNGFELDSTIANIVRNKINNRN